MMASTMGEAGGGAPERRDHALAACLSGLRIAIYAATACQTVYAGDRGELFVASDLQIDPSQVAVDVNSSGAFVVVRHKAGGGGVKARSSSVGRSTRSSRKTTSRSSTGAARRSGVGRA